MTETNINNPFRSFWMGGFECTDKLNAFGNRVDFLHTTRHLELIHEDYNRLHPFNILTVREGLRWSQVEKSPYQYDFSTLKVMLAAGKACGIQQIWDICHFGFPDDLTPLHPHFTNRFASLCRAFVKFYRSECPDEPLIVTPINEVSFLSWLGGDARGTPPYCTGNGWHVKYQLMKAYIAGIYAMKEIDPSIRVLTTEPLVNVVPPVDATEEQIAEAIAMNEDQYQAVDILCGNICPELGGSPDLLDIIGFNYYYNNQWVTGFREFLPWVNDSLDERWKPLRDLLTAAYSRYHKPIVLTETSHPGDDRPIWIEFIAEECAALCNDGIPFWGICLYPIIDRPDWDHLDNWHRSGLWDEDLINQQRVLNTPYAESLLQAQANFGIIRDSIELM